MSGPHNTFLVGEHQWQVIAPMVNVPLITGGRVILDHGAILPTAAVTLATIERLRAGGFIRILGEA